MNRDELLLRGQRLEEVLGSPHEPSSPTGFAAAVRADEAEVFPDEAWQALVELGYFELFVPARAGGRFEHLDEVLTLGRLVARRDLGLAIAAGQCLLGALPVWIAGSEEQVQAQAQKLLAGGAGALALTEREHGSDLAGGEVRAEPDPQAWGPPGVYRLHGEKWCINNATRGRSLTVLARTDAQGGPRGFSVFWLDKDQLEMTRYRPIPKLRTHGIRAADISGVVFEALPVSASACVGKVGRGLDIVLRTLQVSRTLCAAFSLGAADTALRSALDFVTSRELYGEPLVELPAVQRLVARASLYLRLADSLALLSCRAAGVLPEQLSVLSAVVKLAVPQLCQAVVDDALTLLGARYYLREEPYAHVQKLTRDAPLITLFDGSAEVNRHVLAGQLSALTQAREAERAARGEEMLTSLRRASTLDEPAPALDLGRLRTHARGRDDVLNALAHLPELHPLRAAESALDENVRAAVGAGQTPRDAVFFDLVDDYARLVTAAAVEHLHAEGSAAEGEGSLDAVAHAQLLRAALDPAPFRPASAPELSALLVRETLERHREERLFGLVPVRLSEARPGHEAGV